MEDGKIMSTDIKIKFKGSKAAFKKLQQYYETNNNQNRIT